MASTGTVFWVLAAATDGRVTIQTAAAFPEGGRSCRSEPFFEFWAMRPMSGNPGVMLARPEYGEPLTWTTT